MILPINQTILNRVYDFSEYSEEELRCKFFQKLEECIKLCNDVSEVMTWIKESGLPIEVQNIMTIWLEDGTLNSLINITQFNQLKTQLEAKYNELMELQKTDKLLLENKIREEIKKVNDSLNLSIGEVNNTIAQNNQTQNSEISNFKREVTQNFNQQKEEVNVKFETFKQEVNKKLEVIFYVGNEEQLKTAIEVSKTRPTKIYVHSDITLNEIIYIPSFTKIIGLGKVEIKGVESLNCYFTNFVQNNPIGYTGTKYITIENLTFNGLNRETALTMVGFAHAENIEIKNCIFKDLHVWHMLELNAIKHGVVKGCVFDNYGNSGSAYTEALQLDNMISSAQFPWFGSYDSTSNDNIIIENNKFTNIGGTCIGGHSFQKGCVQRNITIKENYFERVNTAIDVNDFNNLQVLYNKSKDTRFFFKTATVENNCENLLIEGNYHQGYYISSSEGIGDERFVGINITGNKGDLRVSFVNISNNFINLCGGHAIGYTADYVTVSNNKFFNIRWNGIYHYGGLVGTISGNTFKDTGKDSGRYAIQVGGNGVTESKAVVVNGNSVANLNGIKVNGNASKILVTNNVGTITNEISDQCTLANNIQL